MTVLCNRCTCASSIEYLRSALTSASAGNSGPHIQAFLQILRHVKTYSPCEKDYIFAFLLVWNILSLHVYMILPLHYSVQLSLSLRSSRVNRASPLLKCPSNSLACFFLIHSMYFYPNEYLYSFIYLSFSMRALNAPVLVFSMFIVVPGV